MGVVPARVSVGLPWASDLQKTPGFQAGGAVSPRGTRVSAPHLTFRNPVKFCISSNFGPVSYVLLRVGGTWPRK